MDTQRDHLLGRRLLLHHQLRPAPSLPRRRPRARLRSARGLHVHVRRVGRQLPDGPLDQLLHVDAALRHLGEHRGLVRVPAHLRGFPASVLDNGLPGVCGGLRAEPHFLARDAARGCIMSAALRLVQDGSDGVLSHASRHYPKMAKGNLG